MAVAVRGPAPAVTQPEPVERRLRPGSFAAPDVAVLAGAIPVEWTMIGLAHLIFIIRVAVAERHAARQRADDLDHFQKLKRERPSGQAQS